MAINIGGEGTKASKLLSPKEVGLLLAKQGGRRGLEGLQGREAESEEEGVQREIDGGNERRDTQGPVDRARGLPTGLNRSGKSCRLRWVNYLHPGLKRGRMTPQEERLVLELHARWGNRWSRIARRLPGRTDNEIKNYWRTHMRKKAQERKRNPSPSSSSSSSSSSLFSLSVGKPVIQEKLESHLLNGTGGGIALTSGFGASTDESVKGYTMDQIWKEIDTSESASGLSFQEYNDEACKSYCPPMPTPMWDYSCDSLWKMDEEDFKTELLVFNYQLGIDN